MLEKWIKIHVMWNFSFSCSIAKAFGVQRNWMVEVYTHTSKKKCFSVIVCSFGDKFPKEPTFVWSTDPISRISSVALWKRTQGFTLASWFISISQTVLGANIKECANSKYIQVCFSNMDTFLNLIFDVLC